MTDPESAGRMDRLHGDEPEREAEAAEWARGWQEYRADHWDEDDGEED